MEIPTRNASIKRTDTGAVTRVGWDELRAGELFTVIADRLPDGSWQFSDKSTWECRWLD